MDQETVRIVNEDADGITFATRHTWKRIHEDELPELTGFQIIGSFTNSTGIYFILRDSSPYMFPKEFYKLLQTTGDEETGKTIMLTADISQEEAESLKDPACRPW